MLFLLFQDSNLVAGWEEEWSYETMDACCNQYFRNEGNCNRRQLMSLKFFAVGDHCEQKALSQFKAIEDRFDSLDDCCRAKFAQNLSECCEAWDSGCALSGKLKFIPVRCWQSIIFQICSVQVVLTDS